LIKLLKILLAVILLLLALALGLYYGADSDIGHRYIIGQIEKQAPKSGLKIKIAGIEGSIYDKAAIKGLKLYDPQGLFFESDAVALDWAPFKYWDNELAINSLTAPTATLHRLPKLNPGKPDAPILPAFNIYVGRFSIDQIKILKGVVGDERMGRAEGKADVRNQKAMVDAVFTADKGDKIALVLDAEPNANLFDVNAEVDAPAGGIVGAVIGTDKPLALRIEGDGNWTEWRGGLGIVLDQKPFAQLQLSALEGRYTVLGDANVASLLQGKAQKLAGPSVKLRGEATLKDRRIRGTLLAQSVALRTQSVGTIDLGRSIFDDLLITTDLLQPQMLFPNMQGRNVQLKLRLDGPFKTPRYEYFLTSPRIAFDQTGLETVRASGQGQWRGMPATLPVTLTATRITGVGDAAGGLLTNARINGQLRITTAQISAENLMFRSDRLNGQLGLTVDLRTGTYAVGVDGQLGQYEIPGLGQVELRSNLRAVPGTNGRGTRVAGRAQVWIRRLDNAFLRDLAGGLPMIDTALERLPDGTLILKDMLIKAPGMTLNGEAIRRPDGSVIVSGTGSQSQYGRFRLTRLAGRIDRPEVTVFLERPNETLGLRGVALTLVPSDQGYGFAAKGQSRLGAFTSKGELLIARNAPLRVKFDDLTLPGVRAKGTLALVGQSINGQLNVAGQGVTGTLGFNPKPGGMDIKADLKAANATLPLSPIITLDKGSFVGLVSIDKRGTVIDGTVTSDGIKRGPLTLAKLAANVKLVNGSGEVRASFAGTTGRVFELQTIAQISPNRITAVGQGSVDGKPIALDAPATITREGANWRLTPVALAYAGGKARMGGLFGDRVTEIDATLDSMPLVVADLISPGMGLSGKASGTLNWRDVAGGQPSGQTTMSIRGLAREGLVLTSRPIDLNLNAAMRDGKAGARMVAASGDTQLGRAQVQFNSINGTDFFNAPLFAQLRFSGAADTLWRLTGVETFDLTGDAAIGADITGSLNTPQIQGSLKTKNARVESTATGMVIADVNATGNFNGSQLVIDQFTGQSGKDGRITGQGRVDFAAANAGVDFTLQAERAELIARDDLAATVTGPIRIKSDADGGSITGDVALVRSRYRLGQTAAVVGVPRLEVEEINRPDRQATRTAAPTKPWQIKMRADANNRMMVEGLGIDSEWAADLRIDGTVVAPTITGTANLIRGGYEFAGRRFELQRGFIRFQGASPPNPILDILAQGDTQGLNANIRVTGTGLKPDIAFTSVPALPQDELLSRLLFGTSITNLSAAEAVQLASAVAAMRDGGNGLNPINALRKAVGLDRLRILPADTITGAKTSVAAGKFITRRTYVEIITDGQGYSATRAEFQITRWLSLLSTISTIGRQSATVRVSKDY
jgi:translocation and assembly module TamB